MEQLSLSSSLENYQDEEKKVLWKRNLIHNYLRRCGERNLIHNNLELVIKSLFKKPLQYSEKKFDYQGGKPCLRSF